MRTNLQARFLAFEDVRQVPDPWGLGVVFHLRREGAPEVQARIREAQRNNPVARAAINAGARATLRSAVERRDGADVEASVQAELERELERFQLDPDDLQKFADEALQQVLARIAGWDGLCDEQGAPIPFSEARALELLTSGDWVDDGLAFGGQTLGAALQAWVLQESRASELYRRQVVEDARGN